MGCHALLQGVFLTQGLNWPLLLSHQGSPVTFILQMGTVGSETAPELPEATGCSRAAGRAKGG